VSRRGESLRENTSRVLAGPQAAQALGSPCRERSKPSLQLMRQAAASAPRRCMLAPSLGLELGGALGVPRAAKMGVQVVDGWLQSSKPELGCHAGRGHRKKGGSRASQFAGPIRVFY